MDMGHAYMITTTSPTRRETNGLEPSTVPVVRLRVASWGTATIILAVAVLVAGCSTSSRRDAAKTDTQSSASVAAREKTFSSEYLAIASAGNDRLETDFDQLSGRDQESLSNARADLSDACATERLFDRRLLMIAFPSAVNMIAEDLYSANESRAKLTAEAAMSPTLERLRYYEFWLSAANEPVEHYVRLIRSSLHLPPPTTS
jgi:hypothetical protein